MYPEKIQIIGNSNNTKQLIRKKINSMLRSLLSWYFTETLYNYYRISQKYCINLFTICNSQTITLCLRQSFESLT